MTPYHLLDKLARLQCIHKMIVASQERAERHLINADLKKAFTSRLATRRLQFYFENQCRILSTEITGECAIRNEMKIVT